MSREEVCAHIPAELADEPVPAFASMPEYANKTRCEFALDHESMLYSLLINNVVEIIGGVLFVVTAFYIIKDKMKCDRYVAGKERDEKEQ